MAYITESVQIVSVSTDPPGAMSGVMPGAAQSQPTEAVGSLVIAFADGLRVTRAVPIAQVPKLAPLVGSTQPLSLG